MTISLPPGVAASVRAAAPWVNADRFNATWVAPAELSGTSSVQFTFTVVDPTNLSASAVLTLPFLETGQGQITGEPNNWPQLIGMSASPGRVHPVDAPSVTPGVAIDDPDNHPGQGPGRDVLSVRWCSSCAGAFAHPDFEYFNSIPGSTVSNLFSVAPGEVATCTIVASVSDHLPAVNGQEGPPRGGVATGVLTLPYPGTVPICTSTADTKVSVAVSDPVGTSVQEFDVRLCSIEQQLPSALNA